MSKHVNIGKYTIYLDQEYYLAYAGGYRELDKKNQKEWDKTVNLPLLLQIEERKKLGLKNNPNIVPMTGRKLLEYIQEYRFVPFFDENFKDSHVLKLTDIIIFESIKQKNYEIAMGK